MTKVLQQPTLILNRNWQPVNVATVARHWCCCGTSRPASWTRPTTSFTPGRTGRSCGPATARTTSAVRFKLRVPEVVALTDYDRLPVAHVTFSRRNIFKRDHFACQYCGAQPGSEELTIDHVVPRAQGGVSSWENCVLACTTCNKRKANRTPEQARMRVRKKPVRPAWKPLYADHSMRMESWSKFISEAYWNVTLKE